MTNTIAFNIKENNTLSDIFEFNYAEPGDTVKISLTNGLTKEFVIENESGKFHSWGENFILRDGFLYKIKEDCEKEVGEVHLVYVQY